MSNAFEAQYVSFKFLKVAEEYALELRVPKHRWAEVYQLLGDPPNAGESKWLGCAPLVPPG